MTTMKMSYCNFEIAGVLLRVVARDEGGEIETGLIYIYIYIYIYTHTHGQRKKTVIT